MAYTCTNVAELARAHATRTFLAEGGGCDPLRTGIRALDDVGSHGGASGIPHGSFLQLNGPAASGKTAIALELTCSFLLSGLDAPRLRSLAARRQGFRQCSGALGAHHGSSASTPKDVIAKAALEIKKEARLLLRTRAKSLGPSVATCPTTPPVMAPVSAVVITVPTTERRKRARSAGPLAVNEVASARPRIPDWLIRGLVASHPLVVAVPRPLTHVSIKAQVPIPAGLAGRGLAKSSSTAPMRAAPSFALYLDFDHKLSISSSLRPVLTRAIRNELDSLANNMNSAAPGCDDDAFVELCVKDCLSRLLVVRPTLVREGCSALAQLAAAAAGTPAATATTAGSSNAPTSINAPVLCRVDVWTGNGALFDSGSGSTPSSSSRSTTLLSRLRARFSDRGNCFRIGLLVMDGHRSMAFEEASQLLAPYAKQQHYNHQSWDAEGTGKAPATSLPQLQLQRLKDISKAVEERLRPLYGDTSLSPLTGHFLALLQQRLSSLSITDGTPMSSQSEAALKAAYAGLATMQDHPSALTAFLKAHPGCTVVSAERPVPSDAYLKEATMPYFPPAAVTPSTLPGHVTSMSLDLALSARRMGPVPTFFRWKLHGRQDHDHDDHFDGATGGGRLNALFASLPPVRAAASASAPASATAEASVAIMSPANLLDGLLGDSEPVTVETVAGAGAAAGKAIPPAAASHRRLASSGPVCWSVTAQPTIVMTAPTSPASSSASHSNTGNHGALNDAAMLTSTSPLGHDDEGSVAPANAAEGRATSASESANSSAHPLHIGFHLQPLGYLPLPLPLDQGASSGQQGGAHSSDTPVPVEVLQWLRQRHEEALRAGFNTSFPYASLTFARTYVRRPFLLASPPVQKPTAASTTNTRAAVHCFPVKELHGMVHGRPGASLSGHSSSLPAGSIVRVPSGGLDTSSAAAGGSGSVSLLLQELSRTPPPVGESAPAFTATRVPPRLHWLIGSSGLV